jgi:uncharacterized membrane protein (DUF485 family)
VPRPSFYRFGIETSPYQQVVMPMTTDLPAQRPGAPDDTYETIQRSPEFVDLRRRLRGFVFPMTAVFFAWYALYVIMSAYARDFMDTKVVGNINVALIFGLLQFVSTFLIAWAYERFATRRLEPVAADLRDRLERGAAAGAHRLDTGTTAMPPAARTPVDEPTTVESGEDL